MKKIILLSLISTSALSAQIPLSVYDTLGNPSVPYLISLRSASGQLLRFIGTEHSKNPNNSQYKTIKNEWESFKKAAGSEKVVLIEAPTSHLLKNNLNSSESQAIISDADRGHAVWLAAQGPVPFMHADLSNVVIVEHLLREFPQDDVYYFCFLQAEVFYQAKISTQERTSFITQQVRCWTGNTTITFETLTKLHQTFSGLSFEQTNASYFSGLLNFVYHTSAAAKIAYMFSGISTSTAQKIYPILRRSNQLRDAHLFNIIKNEWAQKKNIFIVFGAMHATALKESLTDLVKS